jgi:acetyl-CoA carboxylase beta subunit
VKNLKRNQSSKNKIPFIMISKSGGARMMEAAYSLMQLAKTSVKLAQLAEEKIPTFHYVQTLLLEERLHLMLC